MPICSYLVYAQPGRSKDVAAELDALPQCVIKEADGGEMMIMMTVTGSETEEEDLQARFKAMEDIECMVLTFGAPEEAVQ